MTHRLRSALRAHPRVMLAVLLAFGIEVLPPSSGLVAHHHTGGGYAHTHAGRIVGVAPAAYSDADAPVQRVGIHRAPSRDWHQHVVRPLIAVRGPAPVPPGPALVTADLLAASVPAARSATLRAPQARGPPLLPA